MPRAVLVLEHFLPYRLSVVSNRISSALAQYYSERFGITILEWRVVAILGRHPDIAATEVAERAAMDKVMVSRAVAGLLRKKLVVREPSTRDLRKRHLALSPRGQALYREVVPLALGFEQELCAALTAAEQAMLHRVLDKLSERMDALADAGADEDAG